MPDEIWTAAKSVHKALSKVWTGDAEIFFTEQGEEDSNECYISDELSEVMGKAPELEDCLLKVFRTHQEALRGHSVKIQEGKLSLLEGNSGDFLAAWTLPED